MNYLTNSGFYLDFNYSVEISGSIGFWVEDEAVSGAEIPCKRCDFFRFPKIG